MKRWSRVPDSRRHAGGLLASFMAIALGLCGALVISTVGGVSSRNAGLAVALFGGIAMLPVLFSFRKPRPETYGPRESRWSQLRQWWRPETVRPLRPWKRRRPAEDHVAGGIFRPAREIGSDLA